MTRTGEGQLRRVGVEIEYGGIDARLGADVVRRVFGGDIRRFDRHHFAVTGTRLGDFLVELDTSLAQKLESSDEESFELRLTREFGRAIGDITSLWLPYEITAPPIPFERLPEMDLLIDALRTAGATGTAAGPVNAFGLQLNVEVAAADADYLVRHVRAFLVLSDWLRQAIGIDPLRDLLPFVDPFPKSYVLRVVDPGYRPDLSGLIADYLADNPTRNRELDMLPLFAYLDAEAVMARVTDAHVKARPTFHYRLPNSRIDDPVWGGVVEEWNRWVKVERLAADGESLEEASRAYLRHLDSVWSFGWAKECARWIA